MRIRPKGSGPVHITKRFVDNQPFSTNGQIYFYDNKLRGFVLCIGKQTKTFYAEQTVKGRCCRVKIGRADCVPPDAARRKARELLGIMAEGRNPNEEKQNDRRERKITLKHVWDGFVSIRGVLLKPTTMRDYGYYMERVFKDWHSRPIGSITPIDVLNKYHHISNVSGGPYATNAMALLRSVFEFAKVREYRPDNPVQIPRLERHRDKRRTTTISEADLPKWFAALNRMRDYRHPPSAQVGCDYLEFVLFTGLRRNEAAMLSWEHVDFVNGHMAFKNTKNGGDHYLPITDHLALILRRRQNIAQRTGSKWVFPSPGSKKTSEYFADPLCFVRHVRKETGINFTIHDLRRTFATAASPLVSYQIFQLLLNHSTKSDVTIAYDRPTAEQRVKRLREPMETIGSLFLAAKAKAQNLYLTTVG